MSSLIDKSALMYAPNMAGPPNIPDEMKIFDARNALAAVIDKARYFGGVTFLTNRGKRVCAVVSVEDAEWLLAERERRQADKS